MMDVKRVIELIHENHDYWIQNTPKEDNALLRKYVIALIHKINQSEFKNSDKE